jgi:hypothetical protein
MPVASEEQVPKPLTYTLMYHFLWCVMFVLSAVALMALFLAAGVGFPRAVLAPWPLLALALAAGIGSFATYAVRLQVLLGEFDKTEAFRWSEASSWGVLIVAPIVWLLWVILEPGVQHLVNGGRPWAPPEAIVSAMVKVEIVVWWLSHLLSVRGLSRGRKRYLVATTQRDAPAGASGTTAPADGDLPSSSRAVHAADDSAAPLAAAGERR